MIPVIPSIEGLFAELWVFGDSFSDVNSDVASIIHATDGLDPIQSEYIFSNDDWNWQVGLREKLGQDINLDDLANDFAATGGRADGPSFAVGGATTGSKNLFSPFGIPDNTGIADQIDAAVAKIAGGVMAFEAEDLVVLWGGSNDLAVALRDGKNSADDLANVIQTIIVNQQANLLQLLNEGGSDLQNVLVVPATAIEGDFNGVPYTIPFLQNAPDPWKALLNAGAKDIFDEAFKSMVEQVDSIYTNINVMVMNPEYESLFQEFGSQFGTFQDYGIENTTGVANNDLINTDRLDPLINEYLYFDESHPTRSGGAI